VFARPRPNVRLGDGTKTQFVVTDESPVGCAEPQAQQRTYDAAGALTRLGCEDLALGLESTRRDFPERLGDVGQEIPSLLAVGVRPEPGRCAVDLSVEVVVGMVEP
jgi:hypothetical protein